MNEPITRPRLTTAPPPHCLRTVPRREDSAPAWRQRRGRSVGEFSTWTPPPERRLLPAQPEDCGPSNPWDRYRPLEPARERPGTHLRPTAASRRAVDDGQLA